MHVTASLSVEEKIPANTSRGQPASAFLCVSTAGAIMQIFTSKLKYSQLVLTSVSYKITIGTKIYKEIYINTVMADKGTGDTNQQIKHKCQN